MPPKSKKAEPGDPALEPLITSLGLSASRTKNVLQSAKSTDALAGLIRAHGLEGAALDEKTAGLIVDLSTEIEGKKVDEEQIGFLVEEIRSKELKSADQIKAGVAFLENAPKGAPIDKRAFDKACGVGVTFTLESLASTLSSYFESMTLDARPADWSGIKGFRDTLRTGIPDLRWANGKDIAVATEEFFTKTFGPKAAATASAGPSKAKAAPKAASAVANTAAPVEPPSIFDEGFLSRLHKPGENPQSRPEYREQHLNATGGVVQTRFPPEPNGYLHIGHAKAITIDFGYAKHHGGRCYLRFDDTNPSGEEGVYFDSILEMVRWLGFEPWKITYSSDNFDKLFELAMKLTKKGMAYICHCDQETMALAKGSGRGSPTACIHRDRPVEENVAEFQAMKDGKYKEKGACLRMKIDLDSGNPYLWDPVAYRVKDAPHHRTGTKWKIYPSYDFAHALCDSIENISHSLCTLEFVDARPAYEWLCDAVEVYKPRQYETARLSLQGTFLSKRKIRKLVEKGHVQGWDDPRLFTLIALRRRGIPPAAMLRFVAEVGVSTTVSETRLSRFEQSIRQTLEMSVARLSLVLEPVKLTIENVADDWSFDIEKPVHPKVPEMGTIKATVRKYSYIERDDFRVTPPADYNRLSPGKSVILMGAPYPVTCTDHKVDAAGRVTEIVCQLEDGSGPNGDRKFKGKDASAIHWVNVKDAVVVDEVRFFEPLFKSDDPSKVDDFEADINPDSLKVIKGALIEPAFFQVAKDLISQAKKEAEERTKAAASFSEAKVEDGAAKVEQGKPVETTATVVPEHDDTPVATASQLVGMECIRFQGMRQAYFAVDKEAVLGCLAEAVDEPAGLHKSDKIILNKIVSLKEEKGKKATSMRRQAVRGIAVRDID